MSNPLLDYFADLVGKANPDLQKYGFGQGLNSGQSVYNAQSVPEQAGRYQDLLDANPYRNLDYNQSWWQKIASKLGFRTGYDDFREQAQINAREYDAGVMSMIQQNEFNDPSAQAERMRVAGQNPDLLGTGDVASAASPQEDPNGMPAQNSEGQLRDALTIGASIAGQVFDLIPQTLAFMTNLSQLKGVRLENDQKELSFNSNAIDYASKFFMEGISETDYRDAFDSSNYEHLLDASKADAQYIAGTLFSDPQAQKRFKLAYGRHAKSVIAEMQKYKSWDEFEKYRKSLLTQRSSQFFSDDDDAMMTLISSITGPLERYNTRIAEINERLAELRNPDLEMLAKNVQISNQLAYENSIDPNLQAQAENTANERMAQENEILNATNDLFAEIMSELGNKDNWWTRICKTLVGIARSYMMSNLHVQFGRHSQYSVNGDTGVITESGNSNFGVSF